jgi:hypothetical protein
MRSARIRMMSEVEGPVEGTEPGRLKKLQLRYGGTCVACGAAIPRGTQAVYHAASKTIRCVTCPDEAAVIEATPIDAGIAGSSAQREYERRAANREAAIKDRFGTRLGGLIVTVTDQPQSTRAWAKGARGERELAEALEGVPKVVVLSDRRVPGTRGNIDHLVIAPGGLFVVDAKRYDGSLRIRDIGGLFRTDERLYVGGRDCSRLADNMGWQVTAVETLLESVDRKVAITPVLCFIGATWPLLFPPDAYRDVRLEDPKSLRRLITKTQTFDAAEIARLARMLATGFPAK